MKNCPFVNGILNVNVLVWFAVWKCRKLYVNIWLYKN